MSKPALSILAILEPKASEIIECYQYQLGVTNRSAHITLAVYYDIEDKKIISHAKQLLLNNTSFDLSYYGVGVFNHCCIIALPTISTKLMKLYMDTHSSYDEFCNTYTSRSNNKWFPHTQIIYTDIEKAKTLLPAIMANFNTIDTKIIGLKVTRYVQTPNGDVFTELFTGNFLT